MTRKISDYMAEAFVNGEPRKRGDNQVRVTDEHVILSYYGYDIARRSPGTRDSMEVNLNGCAGGAGWSTATDRLRAIGVQMHFFNGEVFAEMIGMRYGGFFSELPVVQLVKGDGWAELKSSREEPTPAHLEGASLLLLDYFPDEWRYWRFRKHRGRAVISLENHESPVKVMGRWWDPSDPNILITVDAPDLPAKQRRFALSSFSMFDDALLNRIEFASASTLERVSIACKLAVAAQKEGK